MNIIQRIVQIFVERTVPIVTSLLASRLEGLIALEQAEHQDELEERARQFERDGKPLLAAALRARAARIDPDNPAFQGLSIIHHLEEDSSGDVPLLESTPPTDLGIQALGATAEEPESKIPVRPMRRRMAAEQPGHDTKGPLVESNSQRLPSRFSPTRKVAEGLLDVADESLVANNRSKH